MRGGAERLAQLRERRVLAVVAVDVAQEALEFCERRAGVQPRAALLEAVADVLFELLAFVPRARDADHRDAQRAACDHRLERGIDLLVREVARRTEQHERVRDAGVDEPLDLLPGSLGPAPRSAWPPNSKRIAEKHAIRRPVLAARRKHRTKLKTCKTVSLVLRGEDGFANRVCDALRVWRPRRARAGPATRARSERLGERRRRGRAGAVRRAASLAHKKIYPDS